MMTVIYLGIIYPTNVFLKIVHFSETKREKNTEMGNYHCTNETKGFLDVEINNGNKHVYKNIYEVLSKV